MQRKMSLQQLTIQHKRKSETSQETPKESSSSVVESKPKLEKDAYDKAESTQMLSDTLEKPKPSQVVAVHGGKRESISSCSVSSNVSLSLKGFGIDLESVRSSISRSQKYIQKQEWEDILSKLDVKKQVLIHQLVELEDQIKSQQSRKKKSRSRIKRMKALREDMEEIGLHLGRLEESRKYYEGRIKKSRDDASCLKKEDDD